MVATFSPHRDGGGTLHLASPTGLHHVDASSAIRQLRRSLSRSPSKGSDFRFITRPSSPSPHKPFHPSPLSPSRRSSSANLFLISANNNSSCSPLAIPYPPSARINRPAMRRNATSLPSTRMRTSPKSPAKRVLVDSTDHGNSAPVDIQLSKSSEDDITPLPSPGIPLDLDSGSTSFVKDASENSLTPVYPMSKRANTNLGSFTPSASPMKRTDGVMNRDHASVESPSAKRRSLHGAGLDFNIFDPENGSTTPTGPVSPTEETYGENETQAFGGANASPVYFSPIPKRSSSLRKSTLQHRQSEKSIFARPKPYSEFAFEASTPAPTKNRFRVSLDTQPMARDSPFSSQGSLPNASMHPMVSNGPNHHSSHPLSRTLTQSSSSSSMDDSPTHEPVHQPRKLERSLGSLDFSKSLPIGSARPSATKPSARESSIPSDGSFATPVNYKMVKPLPAAFMSTGLISKKNRNVEDPQIAAAENKLMPDTPCKRPINVLPVHKSIHDEKIRSFRPSFGTPSTPFSPQISRAAPTAFGKGVGIFGSSFKPEISRRGSFVDIDVDEPSQSLLQSPSARQDRQSTADSDFPPTPTKRFSPRNPDESRPRTRNRARTLESLPGANSLNSSPLHEKYQRLSPHTPQDSLLPPDPSGLSISAQSQRPPLFRSSSSNAADHPPATPTANREYFPLGRRPSVPIQTFGAPDVDPALTSRFQKVELVGTGEFSQVYRVSNTPEMPFSNSHTPLSTRSTSFSSLPDRVWAVKKAKHSYAGVKDRQRKLHEVNVLKALGHSDHTISFVDSWEEKNHLYIQTEFCDEGSLDTFLTQVGTKGRLDDFRIWKILLELSLGLKHIHDSGFIHLDLKPANILITFEGVLKIADFGMATEWPAAAGIEGEGDREYIGPEILMGKYDKPADIFALGLIIFETAGNVELPDNGMSWQKLRSGDLSDVPSLTWSSGASTVYRDASGNPVPETLSLIDDMYDTDSDNEALPSLMTTRGKFNHAQKKTNHMMRSGELAEPPDFMIDATHPQALDTIVRWMISPDPQNRPVAQDIIDTLGVQWAQQRRRAGATVFEGIWGPADEVLAEDTEMIDV